MDWRTAYLAQARSDYERFSELRTRDDIALCHKLHYLQMATEKFAKGLLTPPGAGPFPRTHDAFLRLLVFLRTQREVRDLFGYGYAAASFVAYVNSLRDTAVLVQELSPEGDDHPNPEYPWEDARGEIISPLDYDFPGLELTNPKMLKLLRFLDVCFASLAPA